MINSTVLAAIVVCTLLLLILIISTLFVCLKVKKKMQKDSWSANLQGHIYNSDESSSTTTAQLQPTQKQGAGIEAKKPSKKVKSCAQFELTNNEAYRAFTVAEEAAYAETTSYATPYQLYLTPKPQLQTLTHS